MSPSEIKALQKRIGTEPDGLWGPKSRAAVQEHLRKLMPTPNPWPESDIRSVKAFFGAAGDESKLESFDFPYPMYYEGKLVKRSRCHRLVKPSLLRILTEIGTRWRSAPKIMASAIEYGGIYNYRKMRGGSSLSMHAFGIAIDLDADNNGNRTPWPEIATMPIEIMEAFAREGWTSAGAWWGRDGMHHEAVRPKC